MHLHIFVEVLEAYVSYIHLFQKNKKLNKKLYDFFLLIWKFKWYFAVCIYLNTVIFKTLEYYNTINNYYNEI